MIGDAPVRVAVVTGGHSFDVLNFHGLFRNLGGVKAYVQHMDDFAASSEAVRDGYDVVLFYTMLKDGPSDEMPWYAGKPKTALEHVGEAEQGIFVLHHAILAYPEWPVWQALVGIEDRAFEYFMDQTLKIQVADSKHPITRGISDWKMVDETYQMQDPDADSHLLLTTAHPKSMKAIGWTRQYRNARVFCFQSGHDNQTWVDEGFRAVLMRGIQWCARRV